MFELTGKVAMVTGAGQGVGAGIAKMFAQQGAKVLVNDLHEERAAQTVEAIRNSGGNAHTSCFDVADYVAVNAACEAAEKAHGAVDILVNNAGIPAGMTPRPFLDTLPEDWLPYVDINLYGVMNCCHVLVKGMAQRGYGRVITISSGAGTVGLGLGVSAYAAGKGGGISFMRHLALENARQGVTANTIAVGLINNQMEPEVTQHLAKGIPAGRLGEPEDIAALCVYLASQECAWMTGQTLQLNGGSTTS